MSELTLRESWLVRKARSQDRKWLRLTESGLALRAPPPDPPQQILVERDDPWILVKTKPAKEDFPVIALANTERMFMCSGFEFEWDRQYGIEAFDGKTMSIITHWKHRPGLPK